MDVTHIASFGNLKYVHVIVDTYSKFTYATPLTGETAKHVVQACMVAILNMGVPWAIKTDNGPAYTSNKFKSWASTWNIKVITGIPYNPQGQGIV